MISMVYLLPFNHSLLDSECYIVNIEMLNSLQIHETGQWIKQHYLLQFVVLVHVTRVQEITIMIR